MTTKRFKGLCAVFCCFALLCALCGAYAAELTADMGYDGTVTYLRRLPLRVQLTNGSEDATGSLIVDINRDANVFDRYSLPLTVAAGATVNAVLPVTLSTKQSVYTVQWQTAGETVAQVSLTPRKVLAPETLIVGVLSAQPQELGWMTITQSADTLKRGEAWQTVGLTPDAFPTDKSGMDFFDMLVVDGVDANLLEDDQRKALDAWLRDGGIVMIGGGAQAAAAFPYFSAYTGISAGALTMDDALGGKLLTLFSLAGEELGQAVPVVALEGATGRAIGAEPLLDLTPVDDGLIFTASFSLSEKPLSSWMGERALWQRMLLAFAQTRYSNLVSSRSDGRYQNNQYVDYEIINQISVPNQGGMALPLILLLVFVALVGFGSYFPLKAADKREWMWVTVPVLCVAGALFIWAASDMLNLRKPIAVSYTTLQQEKDGSQTSFTGLGVASAKAGRNSVSLAQGTLNVDQQMDYYYEQTEDGTTPARTLRYESVLGDPETLSFEQRVTWDQSTFTTANVPLADCRVSALAEWEDGTLVFSVENLGAVPLSDGLVMSDYGFATIPALLPGQTVTATLTPHAGVITDSSEIGDGVLLSDAERRQFSFYDYINRYQTVKKKAVESRTLDIRYALLQAFANNNNWYNGVGDPRYIAFADGLADVRATMNGEGVTRTGSAGLFCARVAVSPVAKDGTVRFLNGSIPVSPAEADGQGAPHAASVKNTSPYTSYRLSDTPVFAFDLSDLPAGFVPEHMDVSPRNVYCGYQAEAYDFAKGEWVGFKTFEYDQHTGQGKEEVVLPKLADCLDEAHTLYVRFSGYGVVEEYADISQPGLTMDGRLK